MNYYERVQNSIEAFLLLLNIVWLPPISITLFRSPLILSVQNIYCYYLSEELDS